LAPRSYVPIYIGAEDVPPEYKQHRFLTADAASSHVAADYAPLEATRYATRTFTRLMYHTCENPETFLKPVTAEIESFEQRLLREQGRLERQASRHLDRGDSDAAGAMLTGYVDNRLLDALDLGDDLVEEVEKRTRARFGIRMPGGRNVPGETYRPESQSMNRDDLLPGDANDIVFCHREGIDEYPREHGAYDDLSGELRGEGQGPTDHVRDERRSALGTMGLAGLGLFLTGLVTGGLLRGRRRS
jgi:dipeptidase